MMQPQSQSSQQLTLFQVENQVDQYIQYTMVEQANTLARQGLFILLPGRKSPSCRKLR